jgi:hypothetical protein
MRRDAQDIREDSEEVKRAQSHSLRRARKIDRLGRMLVQPASRLHRPSAIPSASLEMCSRASRRDIDEARSERDPDLI